MTDKIDLLKKFTRLANHNPNEHEANVAARRACKLLEELNWQLTVTTKVPPTAPTNQQQWNPPWSNTPPPNQQQRPPEYYNPFETGYEQFYERMRNDVSEAAKRQRAEREAHREQEEKERDRKRRVAEEEKLRAERNRNPKSPFWAGWGSDIPYVIFDTEPTGGGRRSGKSYQTGIKVHHFDPLGNFCIKCNLTKLEIMSDTRNFKCRG